jgi:plastocyanin
MKLLKLIKLIFLFLLLIVGSGVMLVGCGDESEVPVVKDNQVLISGYRFLPQDISIKVGTTVTWVNEDSVVHTVEGSGMDSGDMGQGDEFTFTFDKVGVYDYICGPHPYMTGSVIVE